MGREKARYNRNYDIAKAVVGVGEVLRYFLLTIVILSAALRALLGYSRRFRKRKENQQFC